MTTELDTFNLLRRSPFNQLLKSLGVKLLARESDIADILKAHNWNYEDYKQELRTYLQRRK